MCSRPINNQLVAGLSVNARAALRATVSIAEGTGTGQRGVFNLGNNGTAEFTAAVARGEPLVFTDNTGVALLDLLLRFKTRS